MSSESLHDKGIELIKSVRDNDMANIRSLLKYVNINFQDDRNEHTPLYMAVCCNHLNVIKYLLEKGADPNITVTTFDANGKIHQGFSTAMIASQRGYNEALQLLLKYKVDVNLLHNTLNTALHMARDLNITKKLLEHGADPNIQNFENETPLHIASGVGYNETTKLLVKHGAYLNIKNSNGNTPLHLIMIQPWESPVDPLNGYSDTVNTLLQFGADTNIFDHYGNLALHKASYRNHTDNVNIMDCLLDYLMMNEK